MSDVWNNDNVPMPLHTQMYGRDGQLQEVVRWLVNCRKFIVTGLAGMGKTALILEALRSDAVVARFGHRRWYVSVRDAVSGDAILHKLGEAMGIPLELDRPRMVLAALSEYGGAVVLDFDVSWEPSRKEIESIIAIDGVSLAIVSREYINSLRPANLILLDKLDNTAARDLFLGIAGTAYSNDPGLENLLAHADGHPLALTLMARQAQTAPSADWLLDRLLGLMDPKELAQALPEQRVGPVAAQVIDGRLKLIHEAASVEAARQEFAIMHDEVRQCALDAREAIGGNHALLIDMIDRYVVMLGENVTDIQGIRLGFAGQRLSIHSEAYKEEDGSDRLYQHQRAALNVLLAAHELLMRSVPEWRDYVLKMGEIPPIAPAVAEQARTIAIEFAKALRNQSDLVDRAVPQTLDEVADMAGTAPASSQQVAHRGLIDALANLFSPLAREALLVRKEVPSEARKMAAKGIILGALTLGGWAATFITGHSVDLVALAQSLPNDFGWLKHVIAALRAMAAKDS